MYFDADDRPRSSSICFLSITGTALGAVAGSTAAGATVAGTLAGGAALGSAGISALGASSAADTQSAATSQAAALQAQEFAKVRNDLQPYISSGATALPKLLGLTGTGEGGNPLTAPLTKPFNPTIADLEQTPGYKFTLDQGQKAVQNSYAAKGLGQSGAAQKGAVDYAEGLAGTTFQQQFQNYLQQNSQIYNMVGGIAGSGQNAAAGTGALALNNTGQINALNTAGANAAAAGQVASANALGGGLGTLGALAYNNSGMFGGSGGASPASYGFGQSYGTVDD